VGSIPTLGTSAKSNGHPVLSSPSPACRPNGREKAIRRVAHGSWPRRAVKTQLFGVPPRVSPHPVLKKFGRFIRQQRKAKDLTQEDLAGAAGLDRTYISHLERGLRNPGRLAKALGIRPSMFFDILG
jgi:DNA-binding XRE family transcriptional regulator